jgi:Ca-activated chloride channel family protein
MEWFNSFSTFELLITGLFSVAYLLYFLRWRKAGKLLNQKGGNWSYKFILRSLYFGLLIIALLGPSYGVKQKEIESTGKDIFFMVDLSKSMDAHDIPPTRLEKVKFELKRIADQFVSDRMGLIIFGSEAFVQCPLTKDIAALKMFIETLNTNLISSGGTDFTPPLQLALDKLLNETENEGQITSKIMIMISDGEDFGEETADALREIRRNGIKVISVGVGTEQGSTIRDGIDVKKDLDGQPVITRLNAIGLREIALETEGRYFEINDKLNETQKLINYVDAIEGELQQKRTVDVTTNKYQYFLAAGLFLMFLDGLVSVRLFKL